MWCESFLMARVWILLSSLCILLFVLLSLDQWFYSVGSYYCKACCTDYCYSVNALCTCPLLLLLAMSVNFIFLFCSQPRILFSASLVAYCFCMIRTLCPIEIVSRTLSCKVVQKMCNCYKCDKCQTLLNGTTHWALPIHTFFHDLDHISRSQEYRTVLTENFMLVSCWAKTS